MKFNLKDIKELADDFKLRFDLGGNNLPPIGIPFLDNRIEEMRNPEGHVASYYTFFYSLAQRYKPKAIVELGAWQGTSAACFAAGNPDSLVITIDHHTDPGDHENRLKTIEATREFENLRYIQGWTCNQLYEEEKDKHQLKGENAYPQVLECLGGQKIDILFIDSWHRYDQAQKDWDAYRPLLNSPALVICDDIHQGSPEGGIYNMVEGFWDKLNYDKFLNATLHDTIGGSYYPMGFLEYINERDIN